MEEKQRAGRNALGAELIGAPKTSAEDHSSSRENTSYFAPVESSAGFAAGFSEKSTAEADFDAQMSGMWEEENPVNH